MTRSSLSSHNLTEHLIKIKLIHYERGEEEKKGGNERETAFSMPFHMNSSPAKMHVKEQSLKKSKKASKVPTRRHHHQQQQLDDGFRRRKRRKRVTRETPTHTTLCATVLKVHKTRRKGGCRERKKRDEEETWRTPNLKAASPSFKQAAQVA